MAFRSGESGMRPIASSPEPGCAACAFSTIAAPRTRPTPVMPTAASRHRAPGANESPVLQYLAHEHQAGAVPDQQLDPVRPLRAEDEDHPREGFESEFMLDQRRQADGTFPEVDRLCRHHHLERPWRDDHSDRLTAASTRAI